DCGGAPAGKPARVAGGDADDHGQQLAEEGGHKAHLEAEPGSGQDLREDVFTGGRRAEEVLKRGRRQGFSTRRGGVVRRDDRSQKGEQHEDAQQTDTRADLRRRKPALRKPAAPGDASELHHASRVLGSRTKKARSAPRLATSTANVVTSKMPCRSG